MARDRKLLALEAATLLVVAGLNLWAVRPLVEEWGTFTNFRDLGPFFPWDERLSYMALRPLHMTGYFLQWVAGGGKPIGVAIVAVLVTVARYAVIRWAVTPILNPVDRWVVATFGAVLLAWPAAWLGRYMGAQISAVVFFIALGCSVRLARAPSWPVFVFGALSAFAVLLFYQALAIAMLVGAVLCAALAWRIAPPAGRSRSALRAGAPFVIGLSAYAIYAAVMLALGLGTYESEMAGGGMSLSFIAERLEAVYASTFGANGLTAPLLLALAIGFLLAGAPPSPRRRHFLLMMSAVLALPVLSLVYLSMTHAADPERTLFPVSVGFVLLLIVAGTVRNGAQATGQSIRPVASLVAVALITSAAFAPQVRGYWDIQSSVISQMLKEELRSDEGVLLKDTTGVLGDLYTFYTARLPNGLSQTLLQYALSASGLRQNVSLCTPIGVDRLRNVVSHLPVASTERCEDVDRFLPYDKVLVAKRGPGGIVLALEPSRRVVPGKPVRFDESGAGDGIIGDGLGGQEPEYRWSIGATASLTVEVEDGAASELVLELAPFLGGGLEAQQVSVAINGVEAGTWSVDRPSDYSVAIPPEALGDGHLAIVLSISDPTEPCQISDSGDCRALGVLIRKLVVN